MSTLTQKYINPKKKTIVGDLKPTILNLTTALLNPNKPSPIKN